MTVKTVKASGGDYTSLQAAINACPSDITAAGTNETWEIECYASATGGQDVSITGKTTDATHYIRIYVPQAERHNGVSGGFSIDSNSTFWALEATCTNLKLEGIRFTSGSGANGGLRVNTAATFNWEVTECLFTGSGTYGAVIIQSVTGGTFKFRNCVKTAGTNSFITASSGSGYTVYAYNCTAYSPGTSQERLYNKAAAGATFVAKNCIGVAGSGASQIFYGSFTSATNNTSSDTSAPGTSATTSWTHNFSNLGGGDFSLTSEVAGTDLSQDPDFGFSVDITGQTRGGWSRGAFEFAPAGGPIDLTAAATAAATASATLIAQRNLAAAAVSNALVTGALSVTKALTASAIGQAVGAAALTVFSQVWRVPTNAPNGTALHVMIMSGSSPTYSLVTQGIAVVAGGFADIPATGTPGTMAFAFAHNYSDNTATTSIRGGPAIATLTSL